MVVVAVAAAAAVAVAVISSSIVSSNTVFAGVLFVHQPGANHAPGASVTKDNHTVHYILWLSLLLSALLALLKIQARIFLFESITWRNMTPHRLFVFQRKETFLKKGTASLIIYRYIRTLFANIA